MLDYHLYHKAAEVVETKGLALSNNLITVLSLHRHSLHRPPGKYDQWAFPILGHWGLFAVGCGGTCKCRVWSLALSPTRAVCCAVKLEGASRGYLLAFLSPGARPGLPPRLLAGDRNL